MSDYKKIHVIELEGGSKTFSVYKAAKELGGLVTTEMIAEKLGMKRRSAYHHIRKIESLGWATSDYRGVYKVL